MDFLIIDMETDILRPDIVKVCKPILDKFIEDWKMGNIRIAKEATEWPSYTPSNDAARKYTSEDGLNEYLRQNKEPGVCEYANAHELAVGFRTPKPGADSKFERSIVKQLVPLFPRYAIKMSGRFAYFGPSAYMSWHTNSDTPGHRLYITYAEEENKSFFRYRDLVTEEIITSYDAKGWIARMFPVTKENPYWHCVYSDTYRISLGFKLWDLR